MYDRSHRSDVAPRSISPGPAAYDPHLPQRPQRPTHAPFLTSSRRLDDGRSQLQRSRVPAATQYLSHQPVLNTAAAVSHAAPPFASRTERFRRREHAVPGVGQYNLESSTQHPAPLRKPAHEVPFGVTGDAHAPDAKIRTVSFAAPRKSPPSIPSALDFGYEVHPDGRLTQQAPPASRVPLPNIPGPGHYRPETASSALSRRSGAQLRFSASRAGRVDFAAMMPATPGPGYYTPALSQQVGLPPSKQLPLSSMSSRSRRGVEVIVGRTATGSRVGPGSHFDDAKVTSFRPRSTSKARTHHFGSSANRFMAQSSNAASVITPAPGTYQVRASTDEQVARARAAAERLAVLWQTRSHGQSHMGPSSEFGVVSNNAPATPRPKADGFGTDGMMKLPHDASQPPAHSRPPVAVKPYPAPVFFSSAPRFGKGDVDRLTFPAPGSYFAASDGRGRASSAPPSRTEGDSSTRGAFNSTAARFGPSSLFPDEIPSSVAAAALGPGDYEVDVIPSARSRAHSARPSSVFRSRSARSSRAKDADLTASTAFAYELRPPLLKGTMSSSGQRGVYDALASRRPEPGNRNGVPGPGTYGAAQQARPDLLALKLNRSRARSAGSSRPLSAAKGSRDPQQLPQPKGIVGAPDTGFSTAARFPAARDALPGPGMYESDVVQPRAQRTYNVVLASSEARALATSGVIPSPSLPSGAMASRLRGAPMRTPSTTAPSRSFASHTGDTFGTALS